jgi:hypothetical protein
MLLLGDFALLVRVYSIGVLVFATASYLSPVVPITLTTHYFIQVYHHDRGSQQRDMPTARRPNYHVIQQN